MKRLLYAIFILLTSVFACSCNKDGKLFERVSELRTEIYEGKSESYLLKAAYGFKEEPYINDGKVGERVYRLTFRIEGGVDNAEKTVEFTHNGETYSERFSLSPVNGAQIAAVEIKDFAEKEFTAYVSAGGKKEEVTLLSAVPENAISYKEALTCLEKKQPELILNYATDTGLAAEIYQRIIVRDGKPYWYVGIASGGNKLKALLIDGYSGEVLAVREVI